MSTRAERSLMLTGMIRIWVSKSFAPLRFPPRESSGIVTSPTELAFTQGVFSLTQRRCGLLSLIGAERCNLPYSPTSVNVSRTPPSLQFNIQGIYLPAAR